VELVKYLSTENKQIDMAVVVTRADRYTVHNFIDLKVADKKTVLN